jgi:LmbE family N-acetylglucosaminyl deacetylase
MNITTAKHNGTEKSIRKLMCILAHPDDESLGFGGLLAHYAHQGVATHLITATRGQRGWLGEPTAYPGPEALGRIRERELWAAAEVLGIEETTLLDYMDGDLDQADPTEIIGLLVSHLRRVRPQVVLTFDPYGIYGHPDHIAICQFTTAAISAAANPHYVDRDAQASHQVSKLYYRAWSGAEAAIYQQVFGDLVMNIDGVKRRATSWAEWAITTQIDATSDWQQVQRAVDCHRSQLLAYERFATLAVEQQCILWGQQNFYRALSLVNGGRAIEHDLFAGISDKVSAEHPLCGEPLAAKLAVPVLASNGATLNY